MADSAAHLDDTESADMPERRCLVTGERRPAEGLVRFVVAPESGVGIVPDVAGRLPGRGLWVTARRDVVAAAAARNVFARAAKAPVRVAPDLADRVESLLARRLVDLVAMARRAGAAVGGFEKVRGAAAQGRLKLRLAADDAGEDGERRLEGTAPAVTVLNDAELGQAFGRESLAHAGVLDAAWAERIGREAARLVGFREADGAEDAVTSGPREAGRDGR